MDFLLPFDAAKPRRRRLPPPVRAPLNKSERVALFERRHENKFLLRHPDDDFDVPALAKEGFVGDGKTANGHNIHNPKTLEFAAQADVRAKIDEERESRKGAA